MKPARFETNLFTDNSGYYCILLF